MQKSKGTWEAAKEATIEAEKQGAEAHLKSCEAEHLLSQAGELTQQAANARSKEAEVSQSDLQANTILPFNALCSPVTTPTSVRVNRDGQQANMALH